MIQMEQFRPLLAATCDDSNFDQLRYPLLASPKLDGIRCLVRNGQLVSRTLKPIRNKALQDLISWDYYEGLDGELISGPVTAKDAFRRTTSAVMSEGGSIDELYYYVFDDYRLPLRKFTSRYDLLVEGHLKGALSEPIIVVLHELIENPEQLLEYEADKLHKGFEGVMLRDPQGKYKHGRSTFNEGILLKLKRGQLRNGDARIIGFTERMHNTNEAKIDKLGLQKRSSGKEGMVSRGDLGSLQVQDIDTGFEFSIGTGVGLNDALRTEIWQNQNSYLGKIVRYEWFAYGNYDKPRFPKFVAFRDQEDVS